jgi:crotonobetainyl-CoA:carnitine CoA-transferase CaiB-like acyl-CoA transferase
MDKLGLGYDALKARNERLIYCSCKGFLPGPYEHRTALDETVQMMAGLAYMTGPPGRPLRAGASVNDIMGGMFAAIGILAALHERHATGRGKHVQSGLFENNVMLMAQHMALIAVTGKVPPPMSVRTPAWSVYDIFDTADDDQVFVGVVTDTQWKIFCEEFGLPDMLADPGLATQNARVTARDVTIPRIAGVLKRYTRADLMAMCEKHGLPYAPIGRPADLFDDPHLNASGGLLAVTLPDGRKTKLPALPLSLDGERLGLRHDLPRPGEHGAAILREMGYADAEIAALRQAGVLI